MKNFIVIIFVALLRVVTFGQVVPDSLIGIYEGQYYYKKSTDVSWEISNSTEYVYSIDTNLCKGLVNGVMLWGTGTTQIDIYTNYSYCNSSVPNSRPLFYSTDSLQIISDNIPQPPPNTFTVSRRFFGKRIPGTSYVGASKQFVDINPQFFPNPTSSKLQIIGSMKCFSLYNSLGILVLETKQNELDVSALPCGIYFAKVISDGKMHTEKIVIEH